MLDVMWEYIIKLKIDSYVIILIKDYTISAVNALSNYYKKK